LSRPTAGIYFGAKAGPRESDVEALENLLGRKLAIRAISVSWDEQWPDERVLDDHDAGRLSLVTWAGTELRAIEAGRYDGLIHQRAQAVRALDFPIFVRWAAEMNGSWHPWGKQPDDYVAAWRRIHMIFEQEGATNVAWVWSPSIPQGNWDAYFPGETYVDWIGGDNYNWGLCREASGGWRSFMTMFKNYHDHFAGTGKPMMLTEVGSAEQGGSKSGWLADAQSSIKSLPALRGWIHQQYADGACDWRVDSSTSALAAYRALVADPYFNAK
jgi:beta-mannanase